MGCNCGKPKCDGHCGVSPAVLQINNPSECVLFHRVEVPASMGDSKTNPPKSGAYKNVLLYYEADQTSWLYSSDGIPQKLVNGLTDYEAAINLPQINGVTLIGDKNSADLKLADAPMVITIATGNTSWSGADTAEDIYNFFLNQGKVNVVFEGSENYGYEIVSAAYIPGEQKMMCMTTVASVDTGSSPVDFSGNALYGLMTFYTVDKAVDVGELDLQLKLSITDFTGLNMTDGYVLEGVPATGSSIGMVKPGDGLEVASDGTLTVIDHVFDTVADMKAATNLVAGSYARTLGYYAAGDGGGATYLITDTANANEIQETIGSTLYATLTNVKTEGYIDLRWLGADNSGVNDSADELERALLYSNKHYLTPIKIVGKFLIGRTISLVGSVSIFGMHVPGTARFFIQQTGTDYELGNISQFILANNITAIKLKGIGNQSTNITTSNIYIKNIDITEVNNSKTSTFLDVNAWGGPSRPNVINSVEGHGINTFLSSVETATFSTSIMNLDMGSCNFWNCGTILNFPAQNPAYDGLMTLYLHDSILEQSKNIILETLCVECNISRNLFENLSNTSTLKIKDSSSLIFDGNYFELNAGNFVFDTYSNIQAQFTSLGYVEFSHPIAVNTSMKFIFKRLNVKFKSYLLHMAVFNDCILDIDELSRREKSNFKLSNLLVDSPNYTICGINPNYTTTDSKELTSDSFFAPANFDTNYSLRQGKKCFTITSGQTLSNTSISGSTGDYIGIYFWRTSNNGESLRLNIVDAGGSGGYVTIPVGNALYDGYWLVLAKLSKNLSNGRLYVNTTYNAPIDCTMIRVMNLGQSPSTTSLYDKLGLYI